jgi:hypothetical protein
MATKEEHRDFLQEVQDFCLRTGMEWRLKEHRNAIERVYDVTFEVWWDGDWVYLARESYPMQPKAHWTVYRETWERIKAEVGHAAARS